ncbi:MAG: prolyl-tRNA synthetase associated domain-containing protein [Alphaproteobacteria bacterium]|nr:prolyl-tRNA synthetase associated domain-containing protein [Alphaproteobacteria bacterium]
MENEPPFNDSGLFARLDALGLTHETVEHDALYTVEQSRALRGDLPGAHIKNLFLRDKKRRMFLVTVLESREMDLKALRQQIGAQGNLSFGNAELLMQHLGVIPGAVTPFSVINDRDGNVTMVLDRALTEIDPVNAHPLRNDRTTAIAPGDLLTFLKAENHAPLILDFDAKS